MRLPFGEVKEVMKGKLMAHDCEEKKADEVTHEVARNSLEGAYTHRINRFARLIRNMDEGIVRPEAEPEIINRFGALERVDGHLGFGITNAWFCMGEAIRLASENGIGMVALRNTNHWLRATTYGYQACEAGMAAICFTNTMPNMPTWGAMGSRIGNDPLVFAFPRKEGHLIVGMTMSQFSYGALEPARLQGQEMQIGAGFDKDDHLTKDPDAVIKSRRTLPTGYWKGAALSFMLDVFASAISMGNTVAGAGRLEGDEHGVSQMFLAIDYQKLVPEEVAEKTLEEVMADLLASTKDEHTDRIVYPGQRKQEVKEDNLKNHIPVDDGVWEEILKL